MAFNGSTSLDRIEVAPASTAFSSADGILYNKAQTVLICCPEGRYGLVTVPDTVTEIASYAFFYSEASGVALPAGALYDKGTCV